MTWTTLAMAKKQIGIPATDCDQDDLLRQLLAVSQGICFQYLQGEPVSSTLTADQIKVVQGAIYLQFAELWRYRGDDADGELPKSTLPLIGAPSMQVERCLYALRQPVIA